MGKVKPRNRYGKPDGFDRNVWDHLPADIVKGKKLSGKQKAILAILIHSQLAMVRNLDDSGFFYRSSNDLDIDCSQYGLEIERRNRSREIQTLAAGRYIDYIVGTKGECSKFRVRAYKDEDRKYIGDVWRECMKKKMAQNAVPVEVMKNSVSQSKVVQSPVVEVITKNSVSQSNDELFDEVVNERKNTELNFPQNPVVERVPENSVSLNKEINKKENNDPTTLLSYRTPIDKKEKKENEKERKAVPSEPVYSTNSVTGERYFAGYKAKSDDGVRTAQSNDVVKEKKEPLQVEEGLRMIEGAGRNELEKLALELLERLSPNNVEDEKAIYSNALSRKDGWENVSKYVRQQFIPSGHKELM